MKIVRNAIERRLKNGESLRGIARSLGTSYQSLQYHRRRWNGKPLRKAFTSGKDHASWKGGFFIDRWGYKMMLCPDRGKASKYVMEHVMVAEKMIGRLLESNEVVHHIDGNKANNVLSNLLVVTRKTHKQLHAQLEAIATQLLRNGKILFDGQRYHLV